MQLLAILKLCLLTASIAALPLADPQKKSQSPAVKTNSRAAPAKPTQVGTSAAVKPKTNAKAVPNGQKPKAGSGGIKSRPTKSPAAKGGKGTDKKPKPEKKTDKKAKTTKAGSESISPKVVGRSASKDSAGRLSDSKAVSVAASAAQTPTQHKLLRQLIDGEFNRVTETERIEEQLQSQPATVNDVVGIKQRLADDATMLYNGHITADRLGMPSVGDPPYDKAVQNAQAAASFSKYLKSPPPNSVISSDANKKLLKEVDAKETVVAKQMALLSLGA